MDVLYALFFFFLLGACATMIAVEIHTKYILSIKTIAPPSPECLHRCNYAARRTVTLLLGGGAAATLKILLIQDRSINITHGVNNRLE
jgi:hypothetical protein